MARDVKSTWNFCNETQYCCLRRHTNKPRRWLCAQDLHKRTKGLSQCDGVCIGSATQQAVCDECATRRKQCKLHKRHWRVGNRTSAQYAPGRVPFKARALTLRNGQVRGQGIHIGLWDAHGLSAGTLGAGSFCEDARGRWYRSVCVRAIHARIGDQRQDARHKETTALVKNHAAMFVGNVNATALARTGMANSVPDAGRSTLGTQRRYNAMRQCGVFGEVSEALSTQACPGCGMMPHARWKGIADPGISAWTCSKLWDSTRP